MPAQSAGNGGATTLLRPKKEKTAIGTLLDLQRQIMNEGGAGGEGEDDNDEDWDKAVAAAMRENPTEMLTLMREGTIEIGKPRARERSEGRDRCASSARRRRREESAEEEDEKRRSAAKQPCDCRNENQGETRTLKRMATKLRWRRIAKTRMKG